MAVIYNDTTANFSTNPFKKVVASALDINCSNGAIMGLNIEKLIPFTPSEAGDCVEILLALTITSNTAAQSVTVELQKNISGSWITQASKTMTYADIIGTHKAEMSSSGLAIVSFVFDTGTYPVALTTDTNTWRIRAISTDGSAYLRKHRTSGYCYVIPITDSTTYSSGDSVVIKQDVELTVDQSVTLTDIWAGVNSSFGNSNPTASYTWTVTGYYYRSNNSVFQAGSSSTPVTFANKLTLNFSNLWATPFIWNGDSQYEDYIYGAYTTTFYSHIASDAASGQKNIVLTDDRSGNWQSGDTLWIWGAESIETKVIDTISGTTVTLTSNLSQKHCDGWVVMNLTRVQNEFGIVASGKIGVPSGSGGTTGAANYPRKVEYRGIYSTNSTGILINTYDASGASLGTGSKNLLCEYIVFNSSGLFNVYIHSGARSYYKGVQNYRYIFKNNSNGACFNATCSDATISNIYVGNYLNPVTISGGSLTVSYIQECSVWSGSYSGINLQNCVASTFSYLKVGKVGWGLNLTSCFNNTFSYCAIDSQAISGVRYTTTSTGNRFINCEFGQEVANTSDISYVSDVLIQDVYENCLWGSTTITGDSLSLATAGSYIKIKNFNQTNNDNRAYFQAYKIVSTGYGLPDTIVWNGTAFTTASVGQYGLKLTPQSGTNLANYYFWDALDSRRTGKLTGNLQGKTIHIALRIKINNAAYYSGTYTLPTLKCYYDNSTTASKVANATTDAQQLIVSFTPSTSTPNIHPYIEASTDASGSNRDIYIGMCEVSLPADTSIDNTKFTYYADGCALPPDSTIPTEESFLSILTSTLTGEGSIGKLLVDNIDAKISTVGGASASEVADAVWDETTSGHETTGTFGEKLGKQPFLVDKNSGFIIKT